MSFSDLIEEKKDILQFVDFDKQIVDVKTVNRNGEIFCQAIVIIPKNIASDDTRDLRKYDSYLVFIPKE
jgi:hypothetical protein